MLLLQTSYFSCNSTNKTLFWSIYQQIKGWVCVHSPPISPHGPMVAVNQTCKEDVICLPLTVVLMAQTTDRVEYDGKMIHFPTLCKSQACLKMTGFIDALKTNFATRLDNFSVPIEAMRFVKDLFCVNVEGEFALKAKELHIMCLKDSSVDHTLDIWHGSKNFGRKIHALLQDIQQEVQEVKPVHAEGGEGQQLHRTPPESHPVELFQMQVSRGLGSWSSPCRVTPPPVGSRKDFNIETSNTWLHFVRVC
ncbi:hypothetical protein F7725_007350 [Scomber scombrus]|uniref:Uncharacterized protein n=1 Tax=Scomber scombrus TaxID=13677 RepID=A0AAV1Q665_SCOSC